MAFSLLDLERVVSGIRRRLRLLEIQGSSGIIKTGIFADRPTDITITSGTTMSFYSTDTKTLSIWNTANSNWDQVVFS